MLLPHGGKSPKHKKSQLPRLLNRHQQANLAVKVIGAFLLLAFVLVAAFIPHGRLMGGGAGGGSGSVLEKRMGASTGPKAPGAAAGAAAGAGAATEAAKVKQGKPAAAAAKAAAEHHQEEHPAAAVELLFDGAVLRDKAGKEVADPMKALEGRAVGLLFGAMWCPMCQSWFPRIQEWLREAGRHDAIAIVYVSSDHDKGAAGTAQLEHGWDLAVPFEDKALRSKLKRRFKVWAMVENREFGQDRTSGIPTIVAVDKKGHVLAHMDVGVEGLETLEKHWRYKEWAW